jgi:hypothetical protein
MRVFLTIACFFLLSLSTKAQNAPMYQNFTANVKDGIVRLDFTLVTGATCNGIQIYRSKDTLNFIEIGEIPGSCGSPTEPLPYTYIDYNPIKNAKSYYKLDFGGLLLSYFVSVEIIDLNSGKTEVRPNPSNQLAQIYFENIKRELRYIQIYNTYGQVVGSFETNENSIQVNTLSFQSGIYSFTVSNSQNAVLIQDKFVVQH